MKTANKIIISLVTLLILLVVPVKGVFAASYVSDEAKVLSNGAINEANENLSELQKNTGTVVKLCTVATLKGQDINDFASNIAKSISSKRYAVFVVAIKEHKNKFLASESLNEIFSTDELNRIASIPNASFKKGDFNTGILDVGKEIDGDITTRAVKTGQDTVDSDEFGYKVSSKKSTTGYGWIIITLLVVLVIIVAIILYIKRKDDEEVEEYDGNTQKGFRSANMDNSDDSLIYHKSYSNFKETGNSTHTTIINNNNDNTNRFVEGMLIGEMLNEHSSNHEHHLESNNDDYVSHSSYSSSDDNDKFFSGDWSSSSGSSDWGSYDSGGSSFDCGGSSDSGTSSW